MRVKGSLVDTCVFFPPLTRHEEVSGHRWEMGVLLHGLLTNTRLVRKLHMGLLFPQDALPFLLLFLSQFFFFFFVKMSENNTRGSFCV